MTMIKTNKKNYKAGFASTCLPSKTRAHTLSVFLLHLVQAQVIL